MHSRAVSAMLLSFGLIACNQSSFPTQPPASSRNPVVIDRVVEAPPTPTPLVTITAGGGSLSLWPYLNSDLSSTPEDPVSLAFHGRVDPRSLRAILLRLDGDRTAFGFPNVAPFNCTWTDAIGDVQAGYAQGPGWVGSAIQLACGSFGPIRFHLRLFGAGKDWTFGGVHFELLIPGTTTHQVMSWELAEQLVTVDLLRSGMLDPANPVSTTGQINAAPFRTIPAAIYNGVPADLRALIGGPAGDQAVDVPIANDGRATVFNVVGTAQAPGVTRQDFVIPFDQLIPKPFCANRAEFALVQGPVHLREEVVVTPDGEYQSHFHGDAHLQITPVDPTASPPTASGATYSASVEQDQSTGITSAGAHASSLLLETLIPPGAPGHGHLRTTLTVDADGHAAARSTVRCAD